MSLLDINSHVSQGDWSRSYLYQVSFTKLPDIVLANLPELFTVSNIDLFNSQVSYPEISTNVQTRNWGARAYPIAGGDSSSHTTDLTFYLDEAGRMHRFLLLLKSLSGNTAQGAQADINDRFFDIMVNQVDVTKSKVLDSFTLEKCMISRLRISNYNKGDNSGTQSRTATATIAWTNFSLYNTLNMKAIS